MDNILKIENKEMSNAIINSLFDLISIDEPEKSFWHFGMRQLIGYTERKFNCKIQTTQFNAHWVTINFNSESDKLMFVLKVIN